MSFSSLMRGVPLVPKADFLLDGECLPVPSRVDGLTLCVDGGTVRGVRRFSGAVKGVPRLVAHVKCWTSCRTWFIGLGARDGNSLFIWSCRSIDTESLESGATGETYLVSSAS